MQTRIVEVKTGQYRIQSKGDTDIDWYFLIGEYDTVEDAKQYVEQYLKHLASASDRETIVRVCEC